ncbi:zinc-ribbon domain [Carpediemonas membranifera]|uniref:Zinc-ribbon domain n=1 Tax=Carpediemonas membranifera TaxID=201153 RepID=A0A8J6E2S4_9EUKA|nr:zinc-ribbon domain [Carpediemonas membranifera]|eukprot:KAG9394676.1 zinc-ribbon domain [Carpediemonas membranifera]
MKCPFCSKSFTNPSEFVTHAKKCRVSGVQQKSESSPRERKPFVLNQSAEPRKPLPQTKEPQEDVFDELDDMLEDGGPPYASQSHVAPSHRSPDVSSPCDIEGDGEPLARTTRFMQSVRDEPASERRPLPVDHEPHEFSSYNANPAYSRAQPAPMKTQTVSGMRMVWIPADTELGPGVVPEYAQPAGPMIYCPFCGAKFQEGASYCGNCGARRPSFE